MNIQIYRYVWLILAGIDRRSGNMGEAMMVTSLSWLWLIRPIAPVGEAAMNSEGVQRHDLIHAHTAGERLFE